MKNVVFFSSGGPGNFATTLDFCALHGGCARVIGLITDRPAIPAIELAYQRGIEVRQFRFSSTLAEDTARRSDCDSILSYLVELESQFGRIDLIVLAFRKIILGNILQAYQGRIINVHPADLSVYDIATRHRRYVGVGGLRKSLFDNRETRTTVHFVDTGIDTGDLLCIGPPVVYRGTELTRSAIAEHESTQKQQSDKPALMRALHLLLCERSCPQSQCLDGTTECRTH